MKNQTHENIMMISKMFCDYKFGETYITAFYDKTKQKEKRDIKAS